MNKDALMFIGLGGAALLGVMVFSKIEEAAVKSALENARDELFDVSPGCESISWKGGLAAPDADALDKAGLYYVQPWLEERLGAGVAEGRAPGAVVEASAELIGVSVLDMLTAEILYDLFPECRARESAPWPPESLFSTFGGIWVAMKLYMDDQIKIVMGRLGG